MTLGSTSREHCNRSREPYNEARCQLSLYQAHVCRGRPSYIYKLLHGLGCMSITIHIIKPIQAILITTRLLYSQNRRMSS